ncbi:MAG: Flp family type IVb pilin [Bacteriovoracia bacterium]
MWRRILKSKQGQTSVEYLLLIAVAISFGLTFMKKMDEYVINNPNGLIGKPLKTFKDKISQDPTNRYRVYPIGPIAK